MDLTTLYCDIDDFIKNSFQAQLAVNQHFSKHRDRKTRLTDSEIITILIYFHASHYRNFKYFYLTQVTIYLKNYFPNILSYTRFIALIPRILPKLSDYLKSKMVSSSNIAFVNSTKIEVCGKKRISRNKVFGSIAKIGKTSIGWFFGFKLHLIVNDKGELLSVKLTKGNRDDRKPVPSMVHNFKGKLFGDKGYISQQLFNELFAKGIHLVTNLSRNMKNKLMPIWDKIMLRKRSIIETIIDQLKNISQIEHTRHRSMFNFMANLIAGLCAYTWQDKKSSITGVNMVNTENLLMLKQNSGF